MHRQAETGMAAAWNQATEAILEIFPAVVEVNHDNNGIIHSCIYSPLQSADFLLGSATIYAQSSATVSYFASIRAGSVCLRTLSVDPQMRVGI